MSAWYVIYIRGYIFSLMSLVHRLPLAAVLGLDPVVVRIERMFFLSFCLRGPIPQETSLDFPAFQSHAGDHLRVTREQIDRLVTPPHLIPVHVQHNPLDRLLRRKEHGLAVRAHSDLESEGFDVGECNELERLRPTTRKPQGQRAVRSTGNVTSFEQIRVR